MNGNINRTNKYNDIDNDKYRDRYKLTNIATDTWEDKQEKHETEGK